jgi:D-inositol-3-phosphate glycosyltransferase
LRRRLGLPADAFIALRVGRPDPRKWSDLLVVHGARLMREFPRLHLVFLSAPANREAVIRQTMGDRATLAPFTTDREQVARYMAASDVMLHYARYGESFGYAIAEAALAGLPVIAQATPWGDNAQAELIRQAETGFIVADYVGARQSLMRLMDDSKFAQAMASAAAADIARRFGVGATWNLLNAFIAHAARGGRGLLNAPEDLAGDQRARLAAGAASYGVRHPLCRRLAAERPLYIRPWYWRLAAADAAAVLKRRLAR